MEKVTCILRLRKGNAFLRLQDLKTKKIMQVCSVYHVKIIFKVGLHMVYKFGIATSENKVINIKYKDNKLTINSFGIDCVKIGRAHV